MNRYRLQEELDGDGGDLPGGGEDAAAAAAAADAGTGEGGTKTILDGDAGTGAPATWPEDWRAKMAGEGNEKDAARLARFDSPDAVYKSYREMENMRASGEYLTVFPKDGTDEDKTAWRKEAGIPETSAGYLEHMEGLVIGEEDKEVVEGYLTAAHGHNATPAQVKDTVDWFYGLKEQAALKREEDDLTAQRETEDALNKAWGPDYRPNVNSINGLLNLASADVQDSLKNARDMNGKPILSDPETVMFLRTLAQEINPSGTLVPGGNQNNMESIKEEIKKIEATIGTNAYDETAQARVRDLYMAEEKMKARVQQAAA